MILRITLNILIAVSIMSLLSCNEQKKCPECPSDFDVDSAKAAIFTYRDSVISALKEAAIMEVDEYMEAAIYQVDTMRSNMFQERDRIIALLDSIENKDNMIIKGDSLHDVEVIFDEITGKPKLIFK